MSNLGNKEIMAANIKRYLDKKSMTAKDLSRAIDVPYTTVLGWVKAEFYPRIDKIEKMAKLWGISKSDLVEDSERAATIQDIYDKNRILFDAADDATQEEIKQAAEYLEYLKSKR